MKVIKDHLRKSSFPECYKILFEKPKKHFQTHFHECIADSQGSQVMYVYMCTMTSY